MRRRVIALMVAAAALSGCYHVTVISAAPSPTVVDKPWQHSFVIGLVPPAEINTFDQCASGVAKVETEISFVNGLVAFLTQSIYTPMHVRVTCATPRR
jgi:hypothetical protein